MQINFTDCFGTPIQVGDTVVFHRTWRKNSNLERGVISSFTKTGNPRIQKTRYRYPFGYGPDAIREEEIYEQALTGNYAKYAI